MDPHVEDLILPPEDEYDPQGLDQLYIQCFDSMHPDVERAIEHDVERWDVGDEFAFKTLETYDKDLADEIAEEANVEMYSRAYSRLSGTDKRRVDRGISAYFASRQQTQ